MQVPTVSCTPCGGKSSALQSFLSLVAPPSQDTSEGAMEVEDASADKNPSIARRFTKGDRLVCNVGGRFGWLPGTIQASSIDWCACGPFNKRLQ